MPGIPSFLSAREMADSDTPHRCDSSRTDQSRKPRAAHLGTRDVWFRRHSRAPLKRPPGHKGGPSLRRNRPRRRAGLPPRWQSPCHRLACNVGIPGQRTIAQKTVKPARLGCVCPLKAAAEQCPLTGGLSRWASISNRSSPLLAAAASATCSTIAVTIPGQSSLVCAVVRCIWVA
jgi:hypothetical protein